MANFFNHYPSTYYSNEDNPSSLDIVTNIIARFGFQSDVRNNTSAFYEYQIKDSDTPEIIASKIYSEPEKHWVVLLFNNIIDPQYDWPLDQRTLITHINDKYAANGAMHSPTLTGIQWAQDAGNVKAYYKTVTRLSSKATKNQIVEKIQIDETTHTNLPVTTTTYTLQNGARITETITKTTQTYYDYEVDLNESKRNIKLLKPEYVDSVFEEFKDIINPS
jgi:hypothetical protein